MRISVLLISVLVALSCGCQSIGPATSDNLRAADIATAKKVASEWLLLVDAGRYGEAFDHYTDAAKQRVKTKAHSIAFYCLVRQPHGSVINRRVIAARYTLTLPMLPEGEYVVIDYVTDFVNKKGVKEEVLCERVNGKWELSGYACGE